MAQATTLATSLNNVNKNINILRRDGTRRPRVFSDSGEISNRNTTSKNDWNV